MDDVDQLSGLPLDEAIATEVFGYKLLGQTTCYFAKGSWGVAPTTNPESWHCYAAIRPVYVWNCYCGPDGPNINEGLDDYFKNESKEDRERRLARNYFAGHETICLTAVDHYNEKQEFAMEAVLKLHPHSFMIHYIDDMWVVELCDDIVKYEARVPGTLDDESTMATAICRAALKFVRKINCPK